MPTPATQRRKRRSSSERVRLVAFEEVREPGSPVALAGPGPCGRQALEVERAERVEDAAQLEVAQDVGEVDERPRPRGGRDAPPRREVRRVEAPGAVDDAPGAGADTARRRHVHPRLLRNRQAVGQPGGVVAEDRRRRAPDHGRPPAPLRARRRPAHGPDAGLERMEPSAAHPGAHLRRGNAKRGELHAGDGVVVALAPLDDLAPRMCDPLTSHVTAQGPRIARGS